MKTELYNEKIEAFLKGELPESESSEIRGRIKSDPEFKRLVELHQMVFEGIEYVIAKDIEKFLPPRLKEPPIFRPIWQTPYFRRAVAIAAIIAGIAFIGFEFIGPQINQKRKIEKIVQASKEINFDVAGENDKILSDAQAAFNKGDFRTANDLFGQYLENSEQNNFEVSLYKGISLRLAGQPQEAVKVFENLVNTANQHYSGDEASWQLALVYLQQGDYASCRAQLNRIIKDKKNTKRAGAKKLRRVIRFK